MWRSGNVGKADQMLKSILKRDPKNFHALHLSALIAFQTGNHPDSRQFFEQAFALNRRDSHLWLNYGNLMNTMGEFEEAEKAFRKALDLQPGMPSANSGIGMSLSGRKLHGKAIPFYNREISKNPDFVAAYNNLGLALLECDRTEEAIEKLTVAVERQPSFVQAVKNLGSAYSRAGNAELAMEQYHKALKLAPNDTGILFNVAVSGMELGRFEDAERALREIEKKAPNDFRCQMIFGNLLMERGRIDESMTYFQKAAEHGGDQVLVNLGLGRACSRLGRFSEAADYYNKVLSIDPTFTDALAGLSTISGNNDAEKLISQLESMLEIADLPDQTSRRIQFSLGEVCDKAGLFDKAFGYYGNGNALKDASFDQPAYEQLITDMIEFFSAEYFEKWNGIGNCSERPVFVVGTPRSGTTLTEQILASHSQVFGAGELDYFGNLQRNVSSRIGGDEAYPSCLDQIGGELADELAADFLDHLAEKDATALRVVDKMPGNFLHLGLIALLFPNVKIIHCQRNPMDACLSIYFQDFGGHHPYAYDLENLGFYYKQYQRLMDHWRQVLPNPMLDSNYEELVANQEEMSRRLVDFVGLEWEDACLEFHKTERVVKTASIWQARQPIYTKSVERWRNYENHLGPLMRALDVE